MSHALRTLTLFGGLACSLLADKINNHIPVAVVEWDSYCCARIREQIEEGWFPGLEVHECDVRDFDPSPYAGRVDCLCAGFPCQDVSRIGSGKGLDGARSGLYAEALRCLRALRCRFAFLENVANIVPDGADRVTADLAAMGYDARWLCLSGGNTGASYIGDRWWCLAEAVRDGLEGISGGGQRRGQLAEAVAEADAAGLRWEPSARLHGRSDEYWHDADGCLRSPPWREDRPGWEVAARYGAPEPGVRRLASAASWRLVKAQIAAIGNAQDPIVAAAAFRILRGDMT